MKIIVAGQDRTQELGQTLRRQTAAMLGLAPNRRPARIPADISALALAHSTSDADYLEQFLRLIRHRDAVGTFDFDIPRTPDLAGRCLARFKAMLWKLLRYQHDRMTFRQHLINNQLTSALLFEVAERRKDVADLQQRVAALEGGEAGEGISGNQSGGLRSARTSDPEP